MSNSVSFGLSFRSQTAIHWPLPSVVIWTKKSDFMSTAASLLTGAGNVHVAPLSVLRANRMSSSGPNRNDSHTAIHVPCPSVITWAVPSVTASLAALVFSAPGGVHVCPLSVLRATRISRSGPMVAPSVSFESQTHTQWPWPSVVMLGLLSFPVSLDALVLSAAGALHVTPLSVLRAVRMS